MHFESPVREPLVLGKDTNYHTITEDICIETERRPSKYWFMSFGLALAVLTLLASCITYTIMTGIGVWNLNKTIGWAYDITNFVWWIGIGHAGTLISAILLLFRQQWRTSINRSAEAMTIFAVFCAGLFPVIHMGRVWNGYMNLPLPNDFGPLWPNFNSALLWDVFAISTYLSVSVVFWYTGLIPDLATMRDRSKSESRKKVLTFFSFGWTGSVRHWNRFELVCLILAGIATPLVLSVHTIVSFDFATSVLPGWHTTIFPPYFVAGAIFSGFAMVHTLLIIARKVMHLEKYITIGHLETMSKVLILTGGLVSLAYGTEFFMAWYSGYGYEQFVFMNRLFGPYWFGQWSMIAFNSCLPQLFWFRKIRRNPTITFIMAAFINVGMWFERFVIIVMGIHRDFLPSSWAMYSPTWVEICIFIGTFGLFFTCFLLFCKYLPVIAIAEVKSIFKITRGGKPVGALVGADEQDYNGDLGFELAAKAKASHDNHIEMMDIGKTGPSH